MAVSESVNAKVIETINDMKDLSIKKVEGKKKFYIFEPNIVKPSGSSSEIMKEYYSGYSFRL